LARGAAGGPVAEQPAGRDAGIEDDAFQRKAVGEPLPRFPGPHRGEAEPERAGHFFLGEAVVEPPAFQDPGEIRPQPAGRVHAPFLAPNAGRGKHFLTASPSGQSPAVRAVELKRGKLLHRNFAARNRGKRNLD